MIEECFYNIKNLRFQVKDPSPYFLLGLIAAAAAVLVEVSPSQ